MNDTDLIIVEGFHAIKHALRFGGQVVELVSVTGEPWRQLAADLAPDVEERMAKSVHVDDKRFATLSPRKHPTGLVGLVKRPDYKSNVLLATARMAPVVLLENPKRTGNVGAVIRVAAAVGAGGVLVTGELDPWGREVVRGAAGLQWALPVKGRVNLTELEGPVVAVSDEGQDIRDFELPTDAVLAFGTERQGLSPQLRQRVTATVSLPMQPGVSSLNLATSVSAVLYWWRLNQSK